MGRARFVVDPTRRGELRTARGPDECKDATALGASDSTQPPAGVLGGADSQRQTAEPKHHRGSLGARFVRGGLGLAGTADDIPYWAYILVAFAVFLLGTAAALPRAKRGLSTALLLAFVGAGIILALTIAYAFA